MVSPLKYKSSSLKVPASILVTRLWYWSITSLSDHEAVLSVTIVTLASGVHKRASCLGLFKAFKCRELRSVHGISFHDFVLFAAYVKNLGE
jgi:hypothetical protein